MVAREPECVAWKRRGADHVANLLAGKSVQEQMDYWRRRTESMLEKQKKSMSIVRASLPNQALEPTA